MTDTSYVGKILFIQKNAVGYMIGSPLEYMNVIARTTSMFAYRNSIKKLLPVLTYS